MRYRVVIEEGSSGFGAYVRDDLRSEYDLMSLRIRKLGPDRGVFHAVRLEPDVATIFPDSQSMNTPRIHELWRYGEDMLPDVI